MFSVTVYDLKRRYVYFFRKYPFLFLLIGVFECRRSVSSLPDLVLNLNLLLILVQDFSSHNEILASVMCFLSRHDTEKY